MLSKNEKKVVFAIYKTEFSLDRAVDRLRLQGFRNNDISVLMPRPGDTVNFAHEKSTKAPEGTTAGVATGAVAGGALGWLIGIGSLAIPGAGPFIAAGPIVAAIAGMGVGGALGGITGALIGMGIPEYEAKRYESFINEGGILLSVHADDQTWVEKAKSTLKSTGGDNIASSSEVTAPSEDSTSDLYSSYTDTHLSIYYLIGMHAGGNRPPSNLFHPLGFHFKIAAHIFEKFL